ncbi:D-alanine--D-alanine ligase [Blattabacterium cuenoti]|uniref:D-alanine--D-alanine ligase n=1 Tax=Blattabacterium cuenoti TaxID=1653831 RepID=UPI00163CD861|nr:D-alanine--D-alanine ligase [Blattabacterium cuenoti]
MKITKKIAIVMGGYSKESTISINSGNTIFNNLCRKKYDPYKVYISKDKWIVKTINNKEYPINKKDFSFFIKKKNFNFDCVFNIIHGTPGEDGILQSYFDLLKIPYTGCGFYHSSITFNKKYCSIFLKNFGINISKSFFININQNFCRKKIIDEIGLPLFVKPSKSGSSIGISKVTEEKNFESALKKAFLEDKEIIVESFLKGKEISVGIYSFNNKINVLPITEIISQNDFFDFESKYSGKSKEITPAILPINIKNKIIKISIKIYKLLNLNGMSRLDFIIVNDTPYFLEINTIPAFSKESIFPKQLKKAGISLSDFFHNLINSCLLYNEK